MILAGRVVRGWIELPATEWRCLGWRASEAWLVTPKRRLKRRLVIRLVQDFGRDKLVAAIHIPTDAVTEGFDYRRYVLEEAQADAIDKVRESGVRAGENGDSSGLEFWVTELTRLEQELARVGTAPIEEGPEVPTLVYEESAS